jgi:hypothetical protein
VVELVGVSTSPTACGFRDAVRSAVRALAFRLDRVVSIRLSLGIQVLAVAGGRSKPSDLLSGISLPGRESCIRPMILAVAQSVPSWISLELIVRTEEVPVLM